MVIKKLKLKKKIIKINLNILTSQKKYSQIQKILKFHFTSFHIPKSLYNSFIINTISYIFLCTKPKINYNYTK